jgi:ADP-ribose pyrophosphatase
MGVPGRALLPWAAHPGKEPMSTFRRKASVCVGEFRVFEVFRHEIEDVSGRALRDAFTFNCRDWVSVVPVTKDGDFVFVRQYRHGIDAPTLEVPGGVIDEGQSPSEAAVRELREETGYGAGTLVPLGASHPNPALQNNWHHMYLVRDVEQLGPPEFDHEEYCELVVLTRAQVRAHIADGSITHALVLLALARAFEVLDATRSAREVVVKSETEVLGELLHTLGAMEELQAQKVIDLARRIHPGLTAEDIRNPHDFPDLNDPDWHFEDGQLVGIQSMVTAIRAMMLRLAPEGER